MTNPPKVRHYKGGRVAGRPKTRHIRYRKQRDEDIKTQARDDAEPVSEKALTLAGAITYVESRGLLEADLRTALDTVNDGAKCQIQGCARQGVRWHISPASLKGWVDAQIGP